MDRGPQFTSGVSPIRNSMLGEQITVGQLKNKDGMTMHMHVMMSSVKFNWALRQSTETAIQHASMPKKSTFRLSSEPLPVLSCKQQTIALSMVCNVINKYILRHSIDVLSLVAIAHPQP